MPDFEERIRDLYVVPAPEIKSEDVEQDEATKIMMMKDRAAVKLVLDDTEQADNFININQWPAGWVLADQIYQSPANTASFDGYAGGSNVSKYTVSNHLSAIIPKVMQGIFYEDPPFLLRPRPTVTQDIVRAKT